MTLANAKWVCRELGYTLAKRDGEFIVKPIGSRIDDARTYFASDLTDAIGTALAMAKATLETK